MLSKVEFIPFLLGAVLSYPIIILLYLVSPETDRIIIFIVSICFMAYGFITKTILGWFYIKVSMHDHPSSYWFNMGQVTGFMIFSLLI